MALLILLHLAVLILFGCAEAGDIINGRPVKPHSKPYMAFVYSGDKNVRCGGILIREDYVLTAAHCPKKTVILGAHDVTLQERSMQYRNVCNAIPHPDYEAPIMHDIMLLKLERKVLKTKYIKTWPIGASSGKVKPGIICSVAGWGINNGYNSDLSPVLRETNLTVVSNEACSAAHPTARDKNLICAGTKNETSTGEGDSGGPLFCGQKLSGIVLGDKKPSLFTDVSLYRGWIKSTMKKEKCKH
ncbi:granzyme-like protein 1 isoform X1 [Eleutherodactylus coqui]|uniref:granzyme-like protein 1 isoform X1 n=2 Tax=Eleutherodactylus coqui TaxID=57060 RepID=UPI003462E1C1